MNLRHLVLTTLALLLTTTIASAQNYRICPTFNMGPDGNGNFMYAANKYEVDPDPYEKDDTCLYPVLVMYIGGGGEEAYCTGAGDCSSCGALLLTRDFEQSERANRRATTLNKGKFLLTKQRYKPEDVDLKEPRDIKFRNCLIPDRLQESGHTSRETELKAPVIDSTVYVTRNGRYAKVGMLTISWKGPAAARPPVKIAYGVECSEPTVSPISVDAFTAINSANRWKAGKNKKAPAKLAKTNIENMKLVEGELDDRPLFIFTRTVEPWTR